MSLLHLGSRLNRGASFRKQPFFASRSPMSHHHRVEKRMPLFNVRPLFHRGALRLVVFMLSTAAVVVACDAICWSVPTSANKTR